MDQAMQGRTTFVVAHRLSTLRRADWVIVLDKGRIVQIGTHEQLMGTKGHYRWAANLQVGDEQSGDCSALKGASHDPRPECQGHDHHTRQQRL
jgi:ABC-type multidrug transport system ATPase subunit